MLRLGNSHIKANAKNRKVAFLSLLTLSLSLLFAAGTWGWYLFQQDEKLAARMSPNASSPAGQYSAGSTSGVAASGKISPVGPSDHILGDKTAPFTLIEYADFECPYCKEFNPVIEQYVSDHIGQARLVYRQYPLGIHANAETEAEASECAGRVGGEAGFWAYHDALFRRTASGGTGFPSDSLVTLAGELHLDARGFSSCLSQGIEQGKVAGDVNSGNMVGVQGTPATVMVRRDGVSTIILGADSYEKLAQDIRLFNS